MNVSDLRRAWEWRSDEDVLEAYARRFEDLSDAARMVVEDEVRKRGLEERARERAASDTPTEDLTPAQARFASFGEIPDEIGAQAFLSILQSHGIRAVLTGEHAANPRYRGSLIQRRLLVHADDMDDARAILAETLRMAREYEENPSCFDCDSPEVVADELSAVERLSRANAAYKCRACGYRWTR